MLRPVVSERFPTGRMIASVRGDAPVPHICIKPFFAQSAGELQGHVEALLHSRFMLICVPCRIGGSRPSLCSGADRPDAKRPDLNRLSDKTTVKPGARAHDA